MSQRRGTVLLSVLSVVTAIVLGVVAFAAYQRYVARSLTARNTYTLADATAIALVEQMQERIIARAQERLGGLTVADINALTADLRALTPAGAYTIDTSGTRVLVEYVTNGEEPIPSHVRPAAVVEDWPRRAEATPPPLGGLRAYRAVHLGITVTVKGRRTSRAAAMGRLVLAQAVPFQAAIYSPGTAELCVTGAQGAAITGPVWSDRDLKLRCDRQMRLTGPLYAGTGLTVISGAQSHVLLRAGALGGDTTLLLSSIPRAVMQSQVEGILRETSGLIRIGAALGERLPDTRFQDSVTAGRGECPDGPAACAGNSLSRPGISVVREVAQNGLDTLRITCDSSGAISSSACASVRTMLRRGAVRYVAFPQSGAAPAGVALNLGDGTPWQGLFVDYRRETRCTATIGSRTLRTFRCPTNPYGYVVDVSKLGVIPGGFLRFRRQLVPGGANPSGYQEVVLLTNARRLPGPLSIQSELPIYIQGDYNSAGVASAYTYAGASADSGYASMLDAPAISLLPGRADTALTYASVWDSVANPQTMVTAVGTVTIRAVLRSNYTLTPASGAYYGGMLEAIPGVVGDWRRAKLRVIGAIEGRPQAAGDATSLASAFMAFNSLTTGVSQSMPYWREVIYDRALRDPLFQPPGSWSYDNLRSDDPTALPSRTLARQRRSVGGYTVATITQAAAPLSPSQVPTISASPYSGDVGATLATASPPCADSSRTRQSAALSYLCRQNDARLRLRVILDGASSLEAPTARHPRATTGTYRVYEEEAVPLPSLCAARGDSLGRDLTTFRFGSITGSTCVVDGRTQRLYRAPAGAQTVTLPVVVSDGVRSDSLGFFITVLDRSGGTGLLLSGPPDATQTGCTNAPTAGVEYVTRSFQFRGDPIRPGTALAVYESRTNYFVRDSLSPIYTTTSASYGDSGQTFTFTRTHRSTGGVTGWSGRPFYYWLEWRNGAQFSEPAFVGPVYYDHLAVPCTGATSETPTTGQIRAPKSARALRSAEDGTGILLDWTPSGPNASTTYSTEIQYRTSSGGGWSGITVIPADGARTYRHAAGAFTYDYRIRHVSPTSQVSRWLYLDLVDAVGIRRGRIVD